jgi:hypothetical protein
MVVVNATEDGIEFIAAQTGSGSGVSTFTELTDTPSSYLGHGGKTLRVTGTEDGLEFIDSVLNISESDTFTGDGETTDFTLSVTPNSATNIIVSINGIVQVPTIHYVLAGGDISFVDAPIDQSVIEVRILSTADTQEEKLKRSFLL